MFISAVRLGLPSLKLTPLQPHRCNIDLCCLGLCYQQKPGVLLPLVHIFQKHTAQFLEDSPWNFFSLTLSSPTTSMPTVESPPLYFRYVLNSLYLFFFCLFFWVYCVFVQRGKSDGCHMSAPPAIIVSSREQTGCHFTTSATFSALLFCLRVLGAIRNRRAEVEVYSSPLSVCEFIPSETILHC